MAWFDISIGAVFGLLMALAFSKMFVKHPKITVALVLACALIGLSLSDDFLTPNDKRWNIFDKIRTYFSHEK